MNFNAPENDVPESGEDVVKHALQTLQIDVEFNVGVYHEPNVWMQHPFPLRGLTGDGLAISRAYFKFVTVHSPGLIRSNEQDSILHF